MEKVSKWIAISMAIVVALFIAVAVVVVVVVKQRNGNTFEEYDYIVVGAGSAGGIVAARLSENAQYTVALLEAGPDNDEFPEADIPYNTWGLLGTKIDWQYESLPQKYGCDALVGKKSPWPRGKGLGGTSLINGMMVTRGSKYDFDRWAEMGNTEWSYDKVLPYFKKMETVTLDRWKSSGYRGTKGPVNIEEPNAFPEVVEAILNSTEQYGYKTLDINDKDMLGWMAYQANMDKGVRESTARAYIKPAMHRANFHVITKAHATKILFEGKNAVGIEYVKNNEKYHLYAKKEIIVSAGSIGSPQLLMLSGIGPRKHLEALEIPVVEDLPVGMNLIDHVMTDAPGLTLEEPVTSVPARIGLKDELQYKANGTGPYTMYGCIATGFERSKLQKEAGRLNPDIQWFVFGSILGNHPDGYDTMLHVLNVQPTIFKALYEGLDGKDGLTVLPNLSQPYSVGEIKLKSSDPFEYPLINPNYLKDDRDVKIIVEGIRRAQEFMDLPPMKALGVKRLERVHPLCKNHVFDSDDYWTCYVKSNTYGVYHPVGTCKMAPTSDPTSVVDQNLRVKNIKGLRVADASIMPYITSGNTNFPCMMIGEKAADIIKGQA